MEPTTELTHSHTPPAPYAPNAILRWIYRRFFSRIQVDQYWTANVRQAASEGVVVYVMRSLSFLDFLCLDFLVKRFGLPIVRFVNDLGLWILEPFGKGELRLSFRRQIPEDEALTQSVRGGFSALLFLRRPSDLGKTSRRGQELEVDHIATLVRAQRQTADPILLVPQVFVWSKTPGTAHRSLLDIVFGPVQWPGRLRVLFQFLLNYRNAQLRSGHALDLREFMVENPRLNDAEVADKVRNILMRRMERERTIVLGPLSKSPLRIQDELMRSPRVIEQLEAHARANNIPMRKVESYARKELRRIAAKQSPFLLGVLHKVLYWLWNRMYDGISIDQEGIERVRNAARDGAIVLLPSHKSHIDYLVLSYVLYDNAMRPPLIAAGENLSFWPLGPFLKRGGAFFIRRSFKGKKLYAALVDAYMRKLMVEGFPIEFFIEGGRSRSGKLLQPKYGLLSMVIDAALLLPSRKVKFVPISIGYEKVIEERSFIHELAGGEKQTENVSDLLKTSSVLRFKWGRLYVQFGKIIEFDAVLRDALSKQTAATNKESDELKPRARRAMIQELAHRVSYSINQVTVVTPAALVATALLSHRKRGTTYRALLQHCDELLQSLERLGARTAPQLRDTDGSLRQDTVDQALQLFLEDKRIVEHDTGPGAIYTIPSEQRIALESTKNTLLHFFVPRALISSALLVSTDDSVSLHKLKDRVQQLSRLFKHEFMFRADLEFDEIFEQSLGEMLADGELVRMADHVRPAEGAAIDLLQRYANMLRTFFESYLLALRAAGLILEGPISKKDWYKKALALGQQMYLAGEIEDRETLSKLKLETALKSLHDYQLIAFTDNDMIEAGSALGGIEDLRSLEPKLYAFIK